MGRKDGLCFGAGLLAVLFMGLPYLILGRESIVTYHDQLDGELIAYLLQAKHLFQGGTLPEFMNNVSKTALVPPAPACVLLFLSGDGFGALAFMQVMGSLCGYAGMYLLARRETGRVYVSGAVAVLYAYLPFLPAYGLSQYGLPLLLYLLLEAREGRHKKAAFLYGAVYALNSSLVLVGFGVLGVLFLWTLWELSAGRRRGSSPSSRRTLLGMLLWMGGIYGVENFRLFAQLLGLGSPGDTVSHKAEYVLFPNTFSAGFLEGLLRGGQHSGDYHGLFFGAAAVVWAVCGLFWLKAKDARGERDAALGKLLKTAALSFGCIVFFAALSGLWDAGPGVFLRRRMQALGAFQLDRLLWLSPCLWYLILACALALAVRLWEGWAGKIRLGACLLGTALAASLCFTGVTVLLESNLKPNIQRLRNPDYKALSFNDYYAVGVYSQVEEFLRERTGEEKEEYRVVSLGIDPAAALYHGFYCLDGYSNNYPLSYKHAFREAIAPELSKNGYLTEQFDGWGNRCYLFSSECPGYFTVEKGGFYFQDYELNVEALKNLGGKYLFSAAYIQDSEGQGLTLLREEAFSTPESYYQIYVYEY